MEIHRECVIRYIEKWLVYGVGVLGSIFLVSARVKKLLMASPNTAKGSENPRLEPRDAFAIDGAELSSMGLDNN